MRGWPAVVVLALAAGGCGSSSPVATRVPDETTAGVSTTTATFPTTVTFASTSTTSPPDGLFEYVGTVLESPDHGPEACAGIVLMSLPPICSGVPVADLSWADVPWAESARGTTWAEVVLVGMFDGQALTLVTTPTPIPTDHVWPTPLPDFSAPCPEPSGGWIGTQTQTVVASAAVLYAESQADFGAHWLYRPDPTVDRVVQVFTFTGNLATHEQRLRDLYNGALCVGATPRSRIEIDAIREELKTLLWSAEAEEHGIYPGYPGLPTGALITMSTGIDAGRLTVNVTVVATLDHDVAEQWLDSRYGVGTVRLTTVLTHRSP